MTWTVTRKIWSPDPNDTSAERNAIDTNMLATEFGASIPVSSKELNIIAKAAIDYVRRTWKRVGLSGWTKQGVLSFSAAYGSAFRAGKSEAMIAGLPIVEVGTNLNSETESEYQVAAPPGTGSRTDLVFIEVFLAEIPASTTSTPNSTNKPSSSAIWKYGNVLFGGTNPIDDIAEIDSELNRRVQVQYRVRAVQGVDFVNFPKGVNDTVNVLAQGTNTSPTTIPFAQDAVDTNLFIAGNGSASHQSTLGTLDGYVYALPIAKVVRNAGQTEVNASDVTDLRDTWKIRSLSLSQEFSAQNDYRLILSGSNLTLERVTGSSINIDGKLYTITGQFPQLSTSGLSPDTTYYIYVYDNAGTIALEASTTGFTIDIASGRPQKTGDSTRRLVGMARTDSLTQWADSSTKRYVISYDHRRIQRAHAVINSTFSTSSTTDSTMLLVEFLSFQDEDVPCQASGHAWINPWQSGTNGEFKLEINGALLNGYCFFETWAANKVIPVQALNIADKATHLSVGYNILKLRVKIQVSGSTANFAGQTNLEAILHI